MLQHRAAVVAVRVLFTRGKSAGARGGSDACGSRIGMRLMFHRNAFAILNQKAAIQAIRVAGITVGKLACRQEVADLPLADMNGSVRAASCAASANAWLVAGCAGESMLVRGGKNLALCQQCVAISAILVSGISGFKLLCRYCIDELRCTGVTIGVGLAKGKAAAAYGRGYTVGNGVDVLMG